MRQIRTVMALAGLSMMTVGMAWGQAKPAGTGTTPAPASSAVVKSFLGTWDGSIATPDGDAPMHLVIEAVGDTALKVKSMSVAMGPDGLQELPVRNTTLADGEVSWTLDAMGSSCPASAVIKNGELRGSTMCAHGQMLFTLIRKPTGN